MSDDESIPSNDAGQLEFLRTGTQYYISARYAVWANFDPVAGNIFHHAVEMILKSILLNNDLTLASLKNEYGHDLEKLWVKFKSLYPGNELDGYDEDISELHKYDDIRYPDELVEKGRISFIGRQRHSFTGVPTQFSDMPKYALGLDEMDALVRKIIDVTTINPKWITETIFPGEAREYLYKENKSWMDDSPPDPLG